MAIKLEGFVSSYVPSKKFQFNEFIHSGNNYQLLVKGPRRTSINDQQASIAKLTELFQRNFPNYLPLEPGSSQTTVSGSFQLGDTVFTAKFSGVNSTLSEREIVKIFKQYNVNFIPDQIHDPDDAVNEFALEDWMVTPPGKKEKDAHPQGTIVANLPMHLGGTLRTPCKEFEEIYHSTPDAYLRIDGHPISSEVDVLRKAVNLAPQNGVYLDFGFGTARTSNEIARQAFPPHAVYAFDVGTGGPAPWIRKDKSFPAGLFAFKTDEQGRLKLPYHDQNVYLSLGLFQEELPKFVKALKESGQKVAFICIDSETYDSSETILNHLGPHLTDGAVVFFDEIQNFDDWKDGHEHLAFVNFLKNFQLQATLIAFNPLHQQAAFRLTKAEVST